MQYAIIYIATLAAANMAIAWLGPTAMPVVAFLLIGLDLTLRDRLHDQWHGKHLWPRMFTLIAMAGVVSYALNPVSGQIAIASVVAFSVASLADAIVYNMLKARSWAIRTNGSNVVSATADSFIFPLLAFGTVLPSIILAQLVAKIAGGMIWALIIGWLGRASKPKTA